MALLLSNVITIQLDSYKKKYPLFLRSRILTISNPVYPCAKPAYPNEMNNTPQRILNVGRLSYQKNQLFLIKSFALIASKNPGWNLNLVGEAKLIFFSNDTKISSLLKFWNINKSFRAERLFKGL